MQAVPPCRFLRPFLGGALVVLACIGSYVIGRMATRPPGLIAETSTSTPRLILHRLGAEKLTNPLIECELGTQKDAVPFAPMEQVIQRAVDQEKATGAAQQVSVYFYTFNSGRWAGVNADETYTAASLLKMPVMMAYYKWAETQPAILNDVLKYDGSLDSSATQNIRPAENLEKGTSYLVSDLLRRMIVYSSNSADYVLVNHINEAFFDEIYSDLHIPQTWTADNQALVTARDYSFFFRVLYNASYLTRSYSEQALALLAQADFKDGLVAGVPQGITIAHKFGERTISDSKGVVQTAELHDCGIVYHQKHPYYLCVMTRGGSLDALKGVIARISEQVYTFVEHDYKTGT